MALCLAIAPACSRPAIAYLSDPVWNGPFAAYSREGVKGFRDSGYSVRETKVPMADLPNGLNATILASKEGLIALSPFFGSEIVRLHAVFPEKTFILPGVNVPEGAGSYGSHTDTGQALELLGRMAARSVMGGGSDPQSAVRYAAAVFPSGEAGEREREDFLRGFESEISDSSRQYLLDRLISEEKAEATAVINEFTAYNVKFLFLSAGTASSAALAAVPERGWTVVGMRLRELSGSHPGLAASVEDDWRALARAALANASAGSVPGAATQGSQDVAVPARIVRLQGDRERLFSDFPR